MSMMDRLNKDVEGWKPEVGETITGIVSAVDTRPSEYSDEDYPTVEIATEDGRDVLVHGFHSVLKKELANQKPQPGDRIGIRYAGLKTPKGAGKDYESYRVIVEHLSAPAPAPDWNAMGASADAELGETVPAPRNQPQPGAYNPLDEREDEEPF